LNKFCKNGDVNLSYSLLGCKLHIGTNAEGAISGTAQNTGSFEEEGSLPSFTMGRTQPRKTQAAEQFVGV
jgi:hypothetical protein